MARLALSPFGSRSRNSPNDPLRQFLFIESIGRERFAAFDAMGAGPPSDSHAEYADGRAVDLIS